MCGFYWATLYLRSLSLSSLFVAERPPQMTFGSSLIDCNYSRTFLPLLPTNVRNRNVEEIRQAIQMNSGEYVSKLLNEDAGNVCDRPTINALLPIYDTNRTPVVRRYQPPQNRSLHNNPYASTFSRSCGL